MNNDVYGWFMVLCLLVGAFLVCDYIRSWLESRELQQELDQDNESDYYDTHISLRRDK